MRQMVRIVAVVVGLAIGVGVAAPARAQSGGDAFTLQPGGTATVTFESFCIDYGKKFPAGVGLPPSGVADAPVAGALNYALSKGYTASQPKEVQFALWKARGAQGSPDTGAQGQEITANANMQPTAPAGATSVVDAIKNNQVKVTAASWQGIGEKLTINNFDDYFQGRGELQIENTSGQPLTLYMPVGTVFPAPSAEFQSMAGYPINVQVSNPEAQQPAGQQTMPSTAGEGRMSPQTLLLIVVGASVLASGYGLRRAARGSR